MAGNRLCRTTVALCALLAALHSTSCSRNGDPAAVAAQAVMVEAFSVQPETILVSISTVGTILANESVVIKPEVPGKLTDIGFREGEFVARGRKLFQLDTDLIDAEYREITANLAFARAQYERALSLKKSRVIPEEQYDVIVREYRNAQARSDRLAVQREKHAIVAPFSGVAGVRQVSPGAYVAIGQDMVALDDIATLKAEFYVPERYHSRLQSVRQVTIDLETLERQVHGIIELISPQVHAQTRSIVVRARVENPDMALKPGMFCKVTIDLEARDNALAIPRRAIVARGDQQYVYVSAGGSAELRPIQTGLSTGDRVEVLEGLGPGDMVITAGMQKIQPGTRVTSSASRLD
jgi:membrane fusion protein (multidrug efflux system)